MPEDGRTAGKNSFHQRSNVYTFAAGLAPWRASRPIRRLSPGRITPNSPDCYIVVEGQKHHWRGEAVMFDETYIHLGRDRTYVSRVILFCDIERPLSNPVLRWINRTVGRRMIRAAATQNVADGHVGVLNHIFSYVYRIRALGERIERWNKPAYYALKWTLLAALGYALVVGF